MRACGVGVHCVRGLRCDGFTRYDVRAYRLTMLTTACAQLAINKNNNVDLLFVFQIIKFSALL